MEAHPQNPDNRVGVRHLRQNLSVYLDRVKAGEELIVTERGVPVARLIRHRPSRIEQMIADGRATPAIPGPLPMPLPNPTGYSLTDELLRMRDEERW